ncbi:MAG: DUF1080 domain-containing protein [Pirellulales bacterium]|nr:DUF1080 domain-containing protein [Pirellulales bacterium]
MITPIQSCLRCLMAIAAWFAFADAGVCDAPEALPTLFDGTNLSAWKVPEPNKWWRVEQGLLRCKNDHELKGSILWTRKEYADFVLRLEFRMGDGTVDSGVFIRGLADQIQIGESGKRKRDMTCSPYIAKQADYPVEATGIAELLRPKDWNTMIVVAVGNHYSVWLNGRHVMEYESKTAIERGPLGLQIHPKREMAIDFRNIRIAEL